MYFFLLRFVFTLEISDKLYELFPTHRLIAYGEQIVSIQFRVYQCIIKGRIECILNEQTWQIETT